MNHIFAAEFETAEQMKRAAGEAAAQGYPASDALSPFPVPEVMQHLAPQAKPVMGWAMAIAGACGGAILWIVEWFSSAYDYPIISGSRPLNSWEIFFIVMFEGTILCSGAGGFITFILNCRLPSLHHPLFEIPAIERASQDRFFLVFEAADDLHDFVAERITQLQPLSLNEVAL